jgi:flagellar basal body-associated protein FliL
MTMTNYDKKPEFNAREAGENSSTTIAIIVAALVLVVGAFLYFGSTSTTPTGQQLTENQVTPAPITEPAAPLPATPPAAQSAAPPATPPADAPAANP